MKKVRRLLGVDPGTNFLGYAIIEIINKDIRLITMDALVMKRQLSHQEKLMEIFRGLDKIIATYKPDEMAIEAPFFGKNVQSMLKLGRAQGVAIAAGMNRSLPVTEYSPKKVKQSVTGNGNASKEQVNAMIGNICKIKVDGKALDASDAAAVAICHYFQSGSSIGGDKKYSSWEKFITENPGRKAR